jgi:hypothetical protein
VVTILFAPIVQVVLFVENKPKGCYVSGRFVTPDVLSAGRFFHPDVLSRWTFYPAGHFVPPDVLSLRMFCPKDLMTLAVLSLDVLSQDVLSCCTFCLWTFCLGTSKSCIKKPLSYIGDLHKNTSDVLYIYNFILLFSPHNFFVYFF